MSSIAELKNYWNQALINNSNFQNDSFRVAEQFDAALNGKDEYPFLHLELPFNITETDQFLEIRYAISITDYLADGTDPFNTLDNCLLYFYQMKKYFKDNLKSKITIENGWTAITITEYSDDNVHGIRVDLTSRLTKTGLC